MICYLGLGANLGDRAANLLHARDALAPAVKIRRASSIYETEPWGFRDQPAFLNQVLETDTDLAPLELLAYLKQIEAAIGRQPTFRYGPRLIDIDILLYDDETVSLPGLEIPHPRLAERAFVLAPLAELAPELRPPRSEKTITEILLDVDLAGVKRFTAAP